MKIRLTEEIWKEGNMYVSYCPELDIASCGNSVEQAKMNLKEVIGINIEESKKMGTFEELLQDAGFDIDQGDVLSLRKELNVSTAFKASLMSEKDWNESYALRITPCSMLNAVICRQSPKNKLTSLKICPHGPSRG